MLGIPVFCLRIWYWGQYKISLLEKCWNAKERWNSYGINSKWILHYVWCFGADLSYTLPNITYKLQDTIWLERITINSLVVMCYALILPLCIPCLQNKVTYHRHICCKLHYYVMAVNLLHLVWRKYHYQNSG
jgi:hypothetical protein